MVKIGVAAQNEGVAKQKFAHQLALTCRRYIRVCIHFWYAGDTTGD